MILAQISYRPIAPPWVVAEYQQLNAACWPPISAEAKSAWRRLSVLSAKAAIAFALAATGRRGQVLNTTFQQLLSAFCCIGQNEFDNALEELRAAECVEIVKKRSDVAFVPTSRALPKTIRDVRFERGGKRYRELSVFFESCFRADMELLPRHTSKALLLMSAAELPCLPLTRFTFDFFDTWLHGEGEFCRDLIDEHIRDGNLQIEARGRDLVAMVPEPIKAALDRGGRARATDSLPPGSMRVEVDPDGRALILFGRSA